jgi:hypothetical protein
VPSVDVIDETFLAVPPARVAPIFADPAAWARFWPDLACEVIADRGLEGMRWTVDGALRGSMEVWLEPMLDGTCVHYYLRAEPVGRVNLRREVRRRQHHAKRIALALKSHLEDGRAPGERP